MITLKNLSKINTNYCLAFSYLRSKFNIYEKKHRVIDVGAGANPWAIDWITHVVDNFIEPKDIANINNDSIEVFKVDIDDPREWSVVLDDVEKNGKFDFVICTHTLEDVNNPKISCEMMNRIGKAGFISMPSKYTELCIFEYKNGFNIPYRGYHHHRWIYQIKNNVLVGFPKMNFHDHIEFNVDESKAVGTEIAFLWENEFDYEFVGPFQMLDNRVGEHRLFHLFENDDLIL